MADGGLDIPQTIVTTANQYGVDPTLALSVAHAESNLDPSAQSPKGAVGVMQLMPDTATGLGVDPHDVHQNIIGGVKYLKQLSDKYGGDHRLVAAAYNAGPGAVDQHGGVPPFPETQAYVDKVAGPDTSAMPSADDIEAHLGNSDGQVIARSHNGGVTIAVGGSDGAPGASAGPSADDIEAAMGFADAASPQAPSTPPIVPQDPMGQTSGFMANLNRGAAIGDELAAGFGTVRDLLEGYARFGTDKPGNALANNLGMLRDTFNLELAKQRGMEAGFEQEHPHLSALAQGTGMAATVAGTEGAGSALRGVTTAREYLQGSRLGNIARGATNALATGAGFAAADAGTPEERLQAASHAAINPALALLGGGAGAMAPTAAKTVNALTGEAEPGIAERVAAFDQAGVRPTLAAVGGPGAATAAKVASSNALVGGRARNALAGSLQDTANAAQRIAQDYGEARGPQITGENVQSGVQTFARDKSSPQSFASKAEALYDKAFAPIQTAEGQAVERAQTDFAQRSAQATSAAQQRAALQGTAKIEPVEVAPQRAVVTPTATITTLQQLGGRVNAPNLSNLITDSRVRSIADALGKDAPDVRFNDLRALRTWVRNAQNDPELRQGVTSAGLQQLEQSLTSDIYNNAERLGGAPALKALQRADDYYRAGMNRIQTALQPFADAKSGENAYSRIIQAAGSTASADAQRLLSLKRSLKPDEWGDVASNVVSELGKPTAGAAHQGFSVNTFVTNYNKLSPRAKSILFDSVGGGGTKASELRGELDNLAQVAGMQKGVEAAANHSNTATHAQTFGMGMAALEAALNPHTIPHAVGGMGAIAGLGELMTNPKAVRLMASIARSKSPAAAAQATTALQQIMARSPPAAGVYATGTSGTPSVAAQPAAAPNALANVSYGR